MIDSTWFDHRRIFLWAVLAALILCLPMLGNGMFMDDYQQRIILLVEGGNAFEFFTRGTPVAEAQFNQGVSPWWLSPDTKIKFLRPFAQGLMEIDYRLWPDSIWLMHLHSILWYVALVALVGGVYRELMPLRWAAGLAAMLFAVDFGHAGAVGWLANRNVLLCMGAGLIALLCLRREGLRWQATGWLAYSTGLLFGESALAITGYFFAHEVFLARDSWQRRFLRLLPFALISLVWLVYRQQGGYGTAGPGFYIDPGHDPAYFLSEMLYRAPAYLAGQWFFPPAEVSGLLLETPARVGVLVYTLLILGVVGWFLWPLLRVSALARFYALGMLIAVIPITASSVVSRALWLVGFGAIGLIALYVESCRKAATPGPITPGPITPGPTPPSAITPRRFGRGFAHTLLVWHLWLSPVLFVGFNQLGNYLDSLMDTRTVKLPTSGEPGQKLLLLGSLSYIGNVSFPMFKDQALSLGDPPLRPEPVIEKIRGLVDGAGEYTVSRPQADTLVAVSTAGFKSLRPARYPFKAGEQIELDDVSIRIDSQTVTASPQRIVYSFQPGVLEQYRVMTWDKNRFIPARLPAVGETLKLKVEAPD